MQNRPGFAVAETILPQPFNNGAARSALVGLGESKVKRNWQGANAQRQKRRFCIQPSIHVSRAARPGKNPDEMSRI
jgi:hypothetical protein